MEDLIYTIIGLTAIYSWIHFGFIQHKKSFNKRTDYEKVVTWVAIVSFALVIIGLGD